MLDQVPIKYIWLFICVVVGVVISAHWGSRDLDVGTDTHAYARVFEYARIYDFYHFKELTRFEFGFLVYTYTIGSYTGSLFLFFFVIPLFFILSNLLLILNTIERPNHRLYFTILTFIVVLSIFPPTVNLSTNLLRQCFALSFVLLSLHFYVNGKKLRFVFFLLTSVFFHSSMVFVVLALLIASYLVSAPLIVATWMLLSVISYLGLNNTLLSFLPYLTIPSSFLDSYAYGREIIHYRTGFRFDFWIYSSIPIFILTYLIITNRLNALRNSTLVLIYTACILSCLHILMFHIPYNDRYGIISWVLYPYIIAKTFGVKVSIAFMVTHITVTFLFL